MSETTINGTNVSECMYYHCKGCTANNFGKCDSSAEIYKNCYYKQLKRTELAFENLKRKGTIPMVFIDSKLIDKYKQALEKIIDIAEKLITETPEYHSCYYKDECGDNCTPKKQSKVEYCCYENVDKILTIINEALEDSEDENNI